MTDPATANRIEAGEALSVLDLLPLRFPYLMIDRVLERTDDRAVAIKNVSHNEWMFQGHFPGRPVLPGTLLIEGMAQTAGLLISQLTGSDQALGYLVGADDARFRRQVVPGDQIVYEAKLLRARRSLFRFDVQARVGDDSVAQAQISLMAETPEDRSPSTAGS